MRYFLCLLVASIACAAQSIVLSVSPTAVQPGGSATLTLTFSDSTPSGNIAGLAWSVVLPAGVVAGTPVLGAAASAGGKILSCGPGTPPLCLLIGDGPTLNDTVLGNGGLVAIPVTVSATALGALSLSLSGLQGATSPGLAATIVSAPVTLTVGSKYDLNGDGVNDAKDVAIMALEADKQNLCAGSSLLIGTGTCALSDVELEIEAAEGKIH